jgi:transketolase
MRNAFLKALIETAEQNPKLMLLTADLGFGLFEPFVEKFPHQYLNVGVAEQNMMGIATGLSQKGYTVFAYSIANFGVLRPYEQIRNDLCYHDANVKIVVSGGGLSYGALGMSHHATEDIAVMRVLPNMQILTPCDDFDAYAGTHYFAKQPGPAYIRLEKGSVSQGIQPLNANFTPGELTYFRKGKDCVIFAYGTIVYEALKAANQLHATGIDATVIHLSTLKPLNHEAIISEINKHKQVISLEEHSITGGLGSILAEIIADHGLRPQRFIRMGMPNLFSSIVGSQEFLRQYYKMDATAIEQQIRNP